ncbi:ROK family protein [Acanthopleuribacter pedis]|uniref:ROK family protein n=1 Tax=Acanthopleuribacter pedis TaxID=442870 RepID=A0A8J7QE92_9BACT|nr:ROK family protein [Acanthopleuribacter pedis]MBO1318050.1 ROK family protein [Acanthopleuribacter pedis]
MFSPSLKKTGSSPVDSNKNTITIGMDIGGTNCDIGFVNQHGTCLQHLSLPTQNGTAFEGFRDAALRLIREQLRQLPTYQCVAMGIAAPGANSRNGRVSDPSNLGWPDVDLTEAFGRYLPFPIYVTNDANAAALGEKKYGAAKDMDNFVLLTLGTGLGAGIFVDGNLLLGRSGFGGELGHTRISDESRLCGCGQMGCLETYVSATGLRRTVMELIAKYGQSAGALAHLDFHQLSAERVGVAAADGDILALEAFEKTGAVLGKKMADWATVLDPEAFILFGGLTRAGEFLLDPVQRSFQKALSNFLRDPIPVVLSGVPHGEAAVLGACHISEFLHQIQEV